MSETLPTRIAGHPRSMIVIGFCPDCGVRWAHLRTVRKEDQGQKTFAHVDPISALEIDQVHAEVAAEQARIADAMVNAVGHR